MAHFRTLFSAQKFLDTHLQELIRHTISPMEVAHIGRDRSSPLRKNWDIIKNKTMRNAGFAKFT